MSLQNQFAGGRIDHTDYSLETARELLHAVILADRGAVLERPWATCIIRRCERGNGELSGGLELSVEVHEGISEIRWAMRTGKTDAPPDPGVLSPADRTWRRRFRPRWKHRQLILAMSRVIVLAQRMHDLVGEINSLARAIDRIGSDQVDSWHAADAGVGNLFSETKLTAAKFSEMTFEDVDYWNQWLQKHTEISDGLLC
jgi:hypothetical protein